MHLGVVHVRLNGESVAFDRILQLLCDCSAHVRMLRVLHRGFLRRRHLTVSLSVNPLNYVGGKKPKMIVQGGS